MHRTRLLGAAAWLGTMLVTGCGSGGDEVATAPLRVAITDASNTYASVVLAITGVRVVPTGSENANTGPGLPLITSFDPARVLDVLQLAFQQQVLGEAQVPVGSYQQVRLILAPNPATGDPVNYVTLPADPLTKLPLTTPSGQQSGLKVVGPFAVTPGVINAIALDFNPDKAIVTAGNSGQRLLKPTGIRIVQLDTILATYGALVGRVLPAGAWPTAVVSITPAGGAGPIASGSVDPDDGTFRALLPPGAGYTVRVTATGYPVYDSAALLPPVTYPVTQGVDTAVGDLALAP